MTATLPTARLSPMAGLFNDLVRYLNRRLRARIGELNTQIDEIRNTNHELRDAANYKASDAAGYIDRTDIWGTQ